MRKPAYGAHGPQNEALHNDGRAPIRYEMPLNDKTPPLNLNQRGHWAKTSPIKARLRKEAATKATQMQIPKSNHITTRLHYIAPDKRRRDSDNIIATAKPLWDGLVDAEIVPDDIPEHMTKIMPKIHPPDDSGPRMWLEIIVSERPK